MREQTNFVGTERGPLNQVTGRMQFIENEQGPLNQVIRTLSETVLASKVKAILVLVGDSLVQAESVEQIVCPGSTVVHALQLHSDYLAAASICANEGPGVHGAVGAIVGP